MSCSLEPLIDKQLSKFRKFGPLFVIQTVLDDGYYRGFSDDSWQSIPQFDGTNSKDQIFLVEPKRD